MILTLQHKRRQYKNLASDKIHALTQIVLLVDNKGSNMKVTKKIPYIATIKNRIQAADTYYGNVKIYGAIFQLKFKNLNPSSRVNLLAWHPYSP